MWVQLLGWGKISKAFTKKLIKLRNLWRVESKSLVARGTEIFAKEEKKQNYLESQSMAKGEILTSEMIKVLKNVSLVLY